MASEDIQTNIRIPAELKDRVQMSAAESGRSLSGEIAYRVLQSYELAELLEKRTTEAKTSSAISARLLREGATKDREIEALRAEYIAAKTTGDLIRAQREADIAAATQFLQERIAFLERRASTAERDAMAMRGEMEVLQKAGAVQIELGPTIARLERDLARLEVDKAYETLTLRVVVSTLRPLLDDLPEDRVLGGILEGATVGEWKSLCQAYIKTKVVNRAVLDKSWEKLQVAEGNLRASFPKLSEVLKDQFAVLQAGHVDEGAGASPRRPRVRLEREEGPPAGPPVEPRSRNGAKIRKTLRGKD